MNQPVFRTARLLVRPRRPGDTEACLAMDREPEVTRFIDGPWGEEANHRAFIEARTRGPWPPGLGYWTIERAGEFLGWVLLIPEDAQGPAIEIGWRLRRAAWGRGIATEAAAPLLRHGFMTLGLPAIIAGIDPENAASLRVAAKLGLVARERAGRYLRHALRREEWLASRED
ncbi:GNAT family N-acetyltransferase [Belnapia sp. T6]|uniref:GNAT family N-acetyltransferase n=1 Tax=Belnapia mucosa TaxID=2804532 RepID=A0ABS1V1L9_9PROT|nr:GNAT family N-acetyltransferase [Belnapia mucosa]MBL6454193.1 GNAT family N-acetyltransferase [Belnapia mucosa]